ncbi:MAG: aminotransferase class IV [Clostridiaceae bacterium]|jgi:branched-chain amino acid aminotransferase|nr:aminotransferase class IV [Clostridiaceae bacterium]
MSSEIIEKYLIINGRIMPVSEAGALSPGSSRTIYEVIKVVSGVPLFLERHMERLEASARLIDHSVAGISNKIQDSISELIKANNSPDKNVKIIVYNMENAVPDYMAYFIVSSYPTPEQYNTGVRGILLKEERSNPNAKVVNSSYKERIAAALSDANAYEALLVNREDEITEGSRSNMFFVRNGKVLTAPRGNVLIGITRVYVFELCKDLGIEITEQPISISMLKEMDGIFMTGTSPKILPISTIDDMHFNSAGNPVIKALMKSYDDVAEEYIRRKKQLGEL